MSIATELTEVLNKLSKEKGVKINNMTVRWIETSDILDQSYVVRDIEIDAKVF